MSEKRKLASSRNSIKARGVSWICKYFTIPCFVFGILFGSIRMENQFFHGIEQTVMKESLAKSSIEKVVGEDQISVVLSKLDNLSKKLDGTHDSIQGLQKQELTTPKSSSSSIETKLGFCKTSSTGWEVILESLIGVIFREGDLLLGQGDILDVGAQFGEQACHLAILAPDRQVIAMDPSPSQAGYIRKKFASKLPNLTVINAGIGSNVGTGKAGKGFTGMKAGDEFQIETIDHVFFEQDRKLAFAHIDVEGRELDVLHGGTRSIDASKPIFTVEVRVHKDPVYTKSLLQYIDQLGYDAYVVNEVCGFPHMDYRNLLCFPRKLGEKLIHSDAFNLAAATQAIFRVDSTSILKEVYPECKLGGELCPGDDITDKECCGEAVVQKWHQRTCRKPVAMQGWTYSQAATGNLWRRVAKRSKIP